MAAFLIAGCGSDEAAVPAEPKTITVQGSLLLLTSDLFWATDTECTGSEGYDDIAAGAQVVIRDESGKSIALGRLEPGEGVSDVECRFPFSIDDVPAGQGIYSVEVSHRGEIAFEEKDAQELALTLGS